MPLAPLATAFALHLLASRNPQLVERYYARRLFPPIVHLLSLINGVASFSIAELLIYVLAAVLIGVLLYQARQIYRGRRQIGGTISADLQAAMWILTSGILIFLVIWGLNYQREPLAAQLGFNGRSATGQQLKLISETIVNEVNANYASIHQGETGAGTSTAPISRADIYDLIEASYQHEPLLGVDGGRYGPPKPIYFSAILSRLGLSGFYIPFTGEPNFNAAQPDFDLPYVMAHEKAHQRGFAREDEANFIAFLICINSTHPFIRYSGYLNGLKVVDTLGASDPDLYRNIIEQVGSGPRSDLRARYAFWARTEGRARLVAGTINNSYLKANGIESGSQSYGEDVALILGYYLKRAERN
jgi:hypothetical protein